MNDSHHIVDVSSPSRWATRAAEVLATAITHSIEQRDRCLPRYQRRLHTYARCSPSWPSTPLSGPRSPLFRSMNGSCPSTVHRAT